MSTSSIESSTVINDNVTLIAVGNSSETLRTKEHSPVSTTGNTDNVTALLNFLESENLVEEPAESNADTSSLTPNSQAQSSNSTTSKTTVPQTQTRNHVKFKDPENPEMEAPRAPLTSRVSIRPVLPPDTLEDAEDDVFVRDPTSGARQSKSLFQSFKKGGGPSNGSGVAYAPLNDRDRNEGDGIHTDPHAKGLFPTRNGNSKSHNVALNDFVHEVDVDADLDSLTPASGNGAGKSLRNQNTAASRFSGISFHKNDAEKATSRTRPTNGHHVSLSERSLLGAADADDPDDVELEGTLDLINNRAASTNRFDIGSGRPGGWSRKARFTRKQDELHAIVRVNRMRRCCRCFSLLVILLTLSVLTYFLFVYLRTAVPSSLSAPEGAARQSQTTPKVGPGGCDKFSAEDVWTVGFPKRISESALRLVDVNSDGIFDVILGYGTRMLI